MASVLSISLSFLFLTLLPYSLSQDFHHTQPFRKEQHSEFNQRQEYQNNHPIQEAQSLRSGHLTDTSNVQKAVPLVIYSDVSLDNSVPHYITQLLNNHLNLNYKNSQPSEINNLNHGGLQDFSTIYSPVISTVGDHQQNIPVQQHISNSQNHGSSHKENGVRYEFQEHPGNSYNLPGSSSSHKEGVRHEFQEYPGSSSSHIENQGDQYEFQEHPGSSYNLPGGSSSHNEGVIHEFQEYPESSSSHIENQGDQYEFQEHPGSSYNLLGGSSSYNEGVRFEFQEHPGSSYHLVNHIDDTNTHAKNEQSYTNFNDMQDISSSYQSNTHRDHNSYNQDDSYSHDSHSYEKIEPYSSHAEYEVFVDKPRNEILLRELSSFEIRDKEEYSKNKDKFVENENNGNRESLAESQRLIDIIPLPDTSKLQRLQSIPSGQLRPEDIYTQGNIPNNPFYIDNFSTFQQNGPNEHITPVHHVLSQNFDDVLSNEIGVAPPFYPPIENIRIREKKGIINHDNGLSNSVVVGDGFVPSFFGKSMVKDEILPQGRSLNGGIFDEGRGTFVPGKLEGGFVPSTNLFKF